MANTDDPREVQNFRRNTSSRSSVSACSSLAMEIKRKKIRESTVFLQSEDTNIQEKIDFEIRMREGAYKLLVASSKREQVLNASKNLLTCNSRIKAYLTELQKKNEEQDMMKASQRRSFPVSNERVACPGKVAISGLRIPLMWKDSDHFNNKGSSRRVAVFCLVRIGSHVFDTEMVVVDRSLTDICFEGVTIFEASPQFDLKVELYSSAIEDETTMVNTPKKLAKKLRNSFGRTSGRKLCPLLEAGDPDAFLQSNPIPPGARYSLLAYTSLSLDEAEGSFQSHSLIILQDAESSSWLPLYGNLCCCLVAQPLCMTQHMMTGYLSQEQRVEGMFRCCSLYCALSAGSLSCYYTPEEITAKVEPSLRIPIHKDTRITVVDKDPGSGRRSNSLTIINPVPGGSQAHVFSADTRQELEDWLEAFWQHFYDQSKWLHCCNQLMKIEVLSPRKPPLFLTKQADSVYNDLSINSPGKLESITDIIHSKIEETGGHFLIGHEEEREPPNWSTLFDGTRPMVVQKTVLKPIKDSPCPSPASSSSSSNANKKRRAPPPPSDQQPYTPEATPTRPAKPPLPPPPLLHQEKENRGTQARLRTKTGRPSLDTKFSAIIQQLQRNQIPARKNAPLGQVELSGPQLLLGGYQAPEQDDPPRLAPVPAPRSKMRKSFREKINPKAW
ncbi:rhotekin-2 isoform X2 [Hypomesus transpacificus]|uniref:rhotekin-2 isoform X2 n=1 Tax=Hypomesus transpacificus TaxID=137520 RepID=UPI001F074359|nr:rhotekin-2 isoform X2 [Hypomesus transpacificus]